MAERHISDIAVRAAHDVVEQALHAAGENRRFALFGVIALDHAHAAERFGEPAGDLGVDLAALAEDRPNGLEGLVQSEAETQQNEPSAISVISGLMRSSKTSAITAVSRPPTKSTRPVPNQIPDAFHVAHDAGHQRAGLVGVIVGDRQAPDVLLHLLAQFGDQALRRLGKQIASERKEVMPWTSVAPRTNKKQRPQLVHVMLIDDVSIRNRVE